MVFEWTIPEEDALAMRMPATKVADERFARWLCDNGGFVGLVVEAVEQTRTKRALLCYGEFLDVTERG